VPSFRNSVIITEVITESLSTIYIDHVVLHEVTPEALSRAHVWGSNIWSCNLLQSVVPKEMLSCGWFALFLHVGHDCRECITGELAYCMVFIFLKNRDAIGLAPPVSFCIWILNVPENCDFINDIGSVVPSKKDYIDQGEASCSEAQPNTIRSCKLPPLDNSIILNTAGTR
jgi:hypothetical protein